MQLDSNGFSRPVFDRTLASRDPSGQLAKEFGAICPGRRIVAPPRKQRLSHETFGSYISAWEAWAVDEETRLAGSSGGVLTALSTWLIETGVTKSVVASGADATSPTRTISLRLTSKEEALAAAGSRYAPVSNAQLYKTSGAENAFVGKPCEVSAVSAYQDRSGEPDVDSPVLLAFFCAGTPSQRATETLVQSMGSDPDSVTALAYRGDGWPGRFRFTTESGATSSLSYDASWGSHLGRDLQWRCKTCVDGTGGHADIAVGDYWDADANGYPIFADMNGRSVAIARTARGHELLQAAAADGVIVTAELDLNRVAAIQPLQVDRKRALPGRLAGRRFAGKAVPLYVGFGLWRPLLAHPMRNFRAAVGTLVRSMRS